jgi:hypothetical protein
VPRLPGTAAIPRHPALAHQVINDRYLVTPNCLQVGNSSCSAGWAAGQSGTFSQNDTYLRDSILIYWHCAVDSRNKAKLMNPKLNMKLLNCSIRNAASCAVVRSMSSRRYMGKGNQTVDLCIVSDHRLVSYGANSQVRMSHSVAALVVGRRLLMPRKSPAIAR